MTPTAVHNAREGHRIGGLLLFWALTLAGCAPPDGPASGPEPSVRFARPLEIYRDLELVTGNADFPAVAAVATLAGPADSTRLLFGLSLPANVLRFQRDGTGFSAGYVVSLRAAADSQIVARVERQETVRVPDFAETSRTDESVLFQTALTLAPGEYVLSVRVRDAVSARGFEATDTVPVPGYGPDAEVLAPPVPVYRADPRTERAVEPGLLLNPRHTAPYGGAAPLVYVEAYGHAPVRLELRDTRGGTVWGRDLAALGGAGVRAAVVALPVDSLPMGRFWLVASAGDFTTRPVPFLVTLSDQWLVANFDEVADLLRYIAPRDEVTALLEASPAERRRLWDAFWEARDPVPATPVNEFRDTFFERIRVATLRFSEAGRPGWRTDRGEVYIVLGPPSRLVELYYDDAYAPGRSRAQEWVYERAPGAGRLSLVFVDRTGLGTYRLTSSSEAAFRAAALRVKDMDRR